MGSVAQVLSVPYLYIRSGSLVGLGLLADVSMILTVLGGANEWLDWYVLLTGLVCIGLGVVEWVRHDPEHYTMGAIDYSIIIFTGLLFLLSIVWSVLIA